MCSGRGARAMLSNRPDYIRCIADVHEARKGFTWCGERADGWAFTGIDHAALNGRADGRLIACPECIKAATEALWNNHGTPEGGDG